MIQIKSNQLMSPLVNVEFVKAEGMVVVRLWDMKGEGIELAGTPAGGDNRLVNPAKIQAVQAEFMQKNEPLAMVMLHLPSILQKTGFDLFNDLRFLFTNKQVDDFTWKVNQIALTLVKAHLDAALKKLFEGIS